MLPKASGARNYTQCDSMLIGNRCGAHTFPYIEVAEQHGDRRARGVHVEDRRRSDLLSASSAACRAEQAVSMIVSGFCKEVFKELPDGVRRRSAAAARHHARGKRRIIERRTCHYWKLRGLTPLSRIRKSSRASTSTVDAGEVHAVMGPNGRARARWRRCCRQSGVRGDRRLGHVCRAKICSRWKPEERAQQGVFLAFQYPVEIPGVSNAYFLRAAYNEIRKAHGEEELDPLEFRRSAWTRSSKLVEMDPAMLTRSVNAGFSGGEKKRNEILQMAVLAPQARDSRRDRFGSRHRRAAHRRRTA